MEPDDGEGTILVDRPELGWMDQLRAYRVIVDGQESGRTSNGETKALPVAAGPHVVQLRIDWSGSKPLKVDVAQGSAVRL